MKSFSWIFKVKPGKGLGNVKHKDIGVFLEEEINEVYRWADAQRSDLWVRLPKDESEYMIALLELDARSLIEELENEILIVER